MTDVVNVTELRPSPHRGEGTRAKDPTAGESRPAAPVRAMTPSPAER